MDKITRERIRLEQMISDREILSFRIFIHNILFPNAIKKFMVLLRKSEYYYNSNNLYNKIIYYLIQTRMSRLSTKLGFYIPINVFDKGLYIPHCGSIVVNPNTKCGKFCLLHNNVVIGHLNGKAPTIGNNVFIGPGAKIFGDIIIADNIWIGANSVVTKSFMEPNVVIAGIPAIKIGYKEKPWNETPTKG